MKKTPNLSLREQVKAYERSLSGEGVQQFRKIYREQSESTSIQKAFVAAKKAAAKFPGGLPQNPEDQENSEVQEL